MKNIPEWKDDVRFLLSESLIGLHSTSDSSIKDDGDINLFTVKDSIYSYQELIQVHGPTPHLLIHLAAGYILIGKFSEAQNTLNQIELKEVKDLKDQAVISANLLVTSALLNSPNFSSR